MLNNRLILRANRATADLTEYLANCKLSIALDEILPSVTIDCALVTNLTTLPLVIKFHETISEPRQYKTLFYTFEVYQVGLDTGELFLMGQGEFNTDTMSTFRAVLAAGHLAGDLIKFYCNGGK